MQVRRKVFSWLSAAIGIAVMGLVGTAGAADYGHITLAQTYSASITAGNTSDRYTVVLPIPGRLAVSITSPGGAAALPNNMADVRWINASNNTQTQLKTTSGGFTFPHNDSMDVAAGTYIIEVVQRSGFAGNTGNYSMRIDCVVNSIGSNNAIGSAQLLPAGYTVRGEITATNTTDMYQYVLTEPGRFSVNMTKSTLSGYVYVRWYNANGTQITYGNPSGSNSYTGSMDLEAGTYYVGVVRDNANGTYNLRTGFTPAGNNEIEPNNAIATAQSLTSGQTVTGFLSYQDDTDMYQYVLAQAGRMTVNLTKGTLSGYVYVRWYNASGTQITYGNPSGSNSYTGSMDLEAGTYYIGVIKDGSPTGTYNVRVSVTPAGNNEVEPNETRPEAQLITSGQTIKGFLSYQDNTDMYRYVLTQADRMTVNLTKGTLSGYVYVRWYNADGGQISYGNPSGSNSYSGNMNLEAGTYYIGIIKDGSPTGTYNLTIHTGTGGAPATSVTSVNIAPSTLNLQTGLSHPFTATVIGINVGSSQGVTWTVTGNSHSGTTISTSGVLTIAPEETATSLTVRATSTANTSRFGTAAVTVTRPPIITTPPADGAVTVGGTFALSVTATGGTPLTYAWYRNTTPTGATGGTLVGSSATYSVSTTTAGTFYYYVIVSNSAGSVTSRVATVTVSPSMPTAPQNFTAIGGNAQVTLSWSAPSSTGGSTITGYHVSSNNGSTWVTASSNTGHTFTGLTNGTSYTFRVRAVNAVGIGAEASATATPMTVPSAPTNFTATPDNAQVSLSWSVPSSNGGSAITGYQVSSNNGSTWVAASSNTSHTFTGLTNGTSYTFRVRALNAAGNGAEAAATATPRTVPTAPLAFTAVAGHTQVSLTWSAPSNTGGSAITGYQVSSNNGTSWVTASSSTAHTFTGLTNGTVYTFRVRAVNIAGNGAEASVTATPTTVPPTAPQSFTAVASNTQVILSWTAPANNGGSVISEYQVSSNNGSTWVTASSNTGHTFTGLTNGTLYTFRVRAVNVAGNGAEATVAATPVPTITFNANGGEVHPTSNATENNLRLAALPVPEWVGKIFVGWFTEATDGTAVTTATIFNDNTTIYAQWMSLINAVTPTITTQPVGGAVAVGASSTLTVAASVNDGGTLSYQWYRNISASNSGGAAISGATSALYAPSTAASGVFYYYVVVTNTNEHATEGQTASVASNAVTLTVGSMTGGTVGGIIGTGTDGTWQIPLNTYYNRSYTQQIYTAAELQAAGLGSGEITSVGFQYFYSVSQTKNNVKIYLKNVSQSAFTSNSWIALTTGEQPFFTGSIAFNNSATGNWVTVARNNATFVWDGVSNILVSVVNNHGSYSTSNNNTFRTHAMSSRTLSHQTDNSSALNEFSPPSASTLSVRNNIRFETPQATTHIITFNLNGGTGTTPTSITGITHGTSLTTTQKPSTDGITLTGYVADGNWYIDAAGTTEFVFGAGGTPIMSGWTLYPKWVPSYTVTFDAGDGVVTPASGTTRADGTLASLPTPTRTGYNFIGWFTEEEGGEEVTTSTVFDVATTIYARYTIKTYSVTFVDWNDTTLSVVNDIEHGSSATAPEEPTRVGYDFDNWDIAFDEVTDNLTVKAQYNPITYTIAYNLNSGDNHASNPTDYTIETSTITFHPPTRTGYTFGGWYDNAGLTGDAVTSIATGGTGDREYWARWTATSYTITYNLNSGTQASNPPASYTVASSNVTLPIPTRTGYEFGGWYDNADLTGDAVMSIATGGTGNREYWANWTPITYAITYNLNDGENNSSNPATYNIANSTIWLQTPGKNGYTFGGWYDNAELEGDSVTSILSGSIGDREYWAKWTPTNYVISYDLNSGTIAVDNPTSYDVETETFTLNNPTRAGYTFTGWTDYYYGGDALAMVTIEKGSTGNKYYYANWVLDIYTITFDATGGDVYPESGVTVDWSSSYYWTLQSLPTPTRNGYTFDGWFTEKEGGIRVYDYSSYIYHNGSYRYGTPFDSNTTIYAQWTRADYTITYYLNDGILEADNPTDYNVETGVITLNPPTQIGYTFTGWRDWYSDDLVTHIDSGSIGNRIFEAQWTLIAYSITYNRNNGENQVVIPAAYNITSYRTYLDMPTKHGYTFDGWYDNSEFTGSQVTFIDNGSTGDREFWAKWTLVTYTVTYYSNTNDGTVANDNPANYDIETATFTLNNPTLTGYTFTGWTWSDQTIPQTAVTIEKGSIGNIWFASNWTQDVYTVTFDPNGGAVDPEFGTTYDGEIAQFYWSLMDVPTPTRIGYYFNGWFTEKVGGIQVFGNTSMRFSSDDTIYAQWTPINYTI